MNEGRKSPDVSILGAGISGLAVAVGLAKLPSSPKLTLYEIRPVPATIGGAVNLTPNALRILEHLGVLEHIRRERCGADIDTIQLFDLYTGAAGGIINFKGKDGLGHGQPPFKALRIMRGELLDALLKTAANYSNITIKYGHKATSITETDLTVSITFEGGLSTTTDILLGCDDIHSSVRSLLVDPARKPTYTGIAVAFSFSPLQQDDAKDLFFNDTTLVTSRRGSFMASFFNAAHDCVYIGGIMEKSNVDSREGWKAKGDDQEQVKQDIKERFSGSMIKDLDKLIANAGDWYLYPVYKLPPGGKWASQHSRIMLLGEAAHAMPPQGESTGIALEDSVLFTRFMGCYPDHELPSIFSQYERLRRPKVDAAYKEASFRWETVKDSGWLAHRLKSMLTPWFLWWTEGKRTTAFEADFNAIDLGLD